MKRYIIFLLLLLIMPICFAGCGEKLGAAYWMDSSKEIEEYFASEEFLSVKNIEFDKDLESLMVQDYGKSYLELSTVYSVLFNSSISYANTYYMLLQNNPQVNNDAFKNKIINLNKKLKNFKNVVDRFIKSKETYETYMNFTDQEKAESNVEKVRLLQFKQEYLNLIESAHELSLSMLNACRVGYYDFNISEENPSEELTKSNIRIAVYLTNAELLTTSIDMLEVYNYLDAYEKYEGHWKNSVTYFNTVLKPFESESLEKTNDINSALSKWKTYYDLYLQDKELFRSIKNSINFERLIEFQHSPVKYAEATKSSNKNRLEYFMNFPTISEGLITYTSNLFA